MFVPQFLHTFLLKRRKMLVIKMSEIDKVLAICLNEVGYAEKQSNANLDSKNLNAGNKNYTKYARDLDNILNFYNCHNFTFSYYLGYN